jgi:hypothetical protein
MTGRLARAHLPPGRQPGPQSRRRVRMLAYGVTLMLGFAIFFAVLGVVGAQHPGKASAAVFYGVFGGLALFALLMAYVLFIVRTPNHVRYFTVTAGPGELRRAERFKAQLQINDPGRIGGELEVGLVCTQFYDTKRIARDNEGFTYKRRVVESGVVHEKWQKAPRDGRTQTFSFEIPPDAPFSYEGAVVSFAWRVSARVPRSRRRDPCSDQPIWVHP